jgi:hypothetical protein
MLRRPSVPLRTQRGEGCSSTAVAEFANSISAVWINLAGRGSADIEFANSAAVP